MTVLAVFTVTLSVGVVFLIAQSRGALLDLPIGLLAVGAVRLRRALLMRGRVALLLGAVVVLVVVGVGLRASQVWCTVLLEMVFGATEFGEGGLSPATLSFRLHLLRPRALMLLQDFPLMSAGPGGFEGVLRALYPSSRISLNLNFVHPHNHLLAAVVDFGVAGLVAHHVSI